MGVRTRRWLAGAVVAVGAALAAGCSTPSQQEYDAAVAAFEALPDEVKAYVCADDWYAVQYEVEGFALVENCRAGRSAPVEESRPLSAEFESAGVQYTETYYQQNPPQGRQLRGVDAEQLCAQSEDELRAEISRWREQTQFPLWEGVEYVPSVDHEIEKLTIWRQAACPLVEQT